MKNSKLYLTIGIVFVTAVLCMTGCGGQLKTKISLAAGEYSGEQVVELTAEGGDSNAEIFYTLDGTEPTYSSYKYDADKKLHISYDATLKARTYDNGSAGPVAEAKYTIKEVKEQTYTDVDRQLLNNIRGAYESADGKNSISININTATVTWSIDGNKGESSKYTISTPTNGDGLSGTMTAHDTDGKEKKFEIKMESASDSTVYFNNQAFNYTGSV